MMLFYVFCVILELNNVGHKTKVSLFFLTGFISQKGRSAGLLLRFETPTHSARGLLLCQGPLPTLCPRNLLLNWLLCTCSHSHTVHSPSTHAFKQKLSTMSSQRAESSILRAGVENDTELHESPSSFFTLTVKCWSRGSLSQGGESVMLIT